ncbi:Vitamin K-dependent gamma-carboxylase [Enhygromyxa salina]|uniref:Vitamin K-dependent gamma-carboxylase n=1 Tax=Enhygromyxa salina TaxID=215803 RepID=A0A2S9YJZ9_9BACT|nr:HTTM domain-containing protein [Enhygromyxa salina]PRQ05428.1 Vitamin K-dependent gamma-carboxylase [Enhygromyxa salina]
MAESSKRGGEARQNPLARVCDALLSGQEDPLALGVLRAVLAGILFVSALLHVGAVGEYFSDESMINDRFAQLAFPSRWSLFFEIRDPTTVRAIWAVGVLALGMWTVGLFTRVSSIVGLIVWISMYGRNPLLYAYPDQLALMFGCLLALMPAGRGFSLDARWFGWGGTVPVWCRRIIQLQLAIVYTVTGLEKTGETWVEEGTAIFYTLNNPYNRHFDAGPLFAALQPWLLEPLTFAVLIWEVSFGGFTAYNWVREAAGRRFPALGERRRAGRPGWPIPDLRWLFLGFGVAMHVGIQLGVYVVFFSPLIVGSYLSFLSSEDLRQLVAWPRRAVARLRSFRGSRRAARAR